MAAFHHAALSSRSPGTWRRHRAAALCHYRRAAASSTDCKQNECGGTMMQKKKVLQKLQKRACGPSADKYMAFKSEYIACVALAKVKLIKAGGSRQQIIVASVTATAPFACQSWPRFVVSLDLNAFRPLKAVSSRRLLPPPTPSLQAHQLHWHNKWQFWGVSSSAYCWDPWASLGFSRKPHERRRWRKSVSSTLIFQFVGTFWSSRYSLCDPQVSNPLAHWPNLPLSAIFIGQYRDNT